MHKCTEASMSVKIDNVQEKCEEHKNCWLYHCKECFTMIHVSKIPLEVHKRLDKMIKTETENNEEETTKNTSLFSKDT